jgi:hypothetical protein
MPGSEEKLSHGEPTWFVGKKVFVMFASNHRCGLPLALLATIAVATLRKPLIVGLFEASALDAASISETVGIVYSARRRRQ